MYSKNDYRYYLEHRLAESDDYLAHYGVKGMKWKKRLKKKITDAKREFDNAGSIPEYIDSRASRKQRARNIANLVVNGDYSHKGRENFGTYKKKKFKTRKQRSRNIAKLVVDGKLD